jgi:hypothetical protein
MDIDRSNYEIWLIDWLDGKLNSLQVEELKLYLEQNPDIREEFEDLTPINLLPGEISFPHKEHLKKSPSDISVSQFEYLCIAYLENDLNDNQQAELLEIVSRYPDRKKTFDLIQKTILPRERKDYKHKTLLLKRTAFQKLIRLSVIGLSTAAAIAIIINIVFVMHGTTRLKLKSSAHNFVPDSSFHRSSPVNTTERILKDSIPGKAEERSENRFASIIKKVNAVSNNKMSTPENNAQVRKTDNQTMAINKVPANPQIDLVKRIIRDTLIASRQTFIIPDVEDERSRAGKFISKTFREKFLKEKTPPDTPLKGYEIAEAGVTGLNKLFGWQMVLDMNNDANGRPSSVNFSSKILKFNAPVKKKEPQP